MTGMIQHHTGALSMVKDLFDTRSGGQEPQLFDFTAGVDVSGKFIDGGTWSAYWYNGFVYGSEIARGLDVYKIIPSKFVTANEIAAAEQVHLSIFNAQAPSKITYPMTFLTAKAYVDQLARSNALPQDKANALEAAMDKREHEGAEDLRSHLQERCCSGFSS